MYVLFTCENPYIFEVDTADLRVDVPSVESACQHLCAFIRTQLDPATWDGNEFSDCKTVEEKTALFKKWVTVIDLLESGNYEVTQLSDPEEYRVCIPLVKHL